MYYISIFLIIFSLIFPHLTYGIDLNRYLGTYEMYETLGDVQVERVYTGYGGNFIKDVIRSNGSPYGTLVLYPNIYIPYIGVDPPEVYYEGNCPYILTGTINLTGNIYLKKGNGDLILLVEDIPGRVIGTRSTHLEDYIIFYYKNDNTLTIFMIPTVVIESGDELIYKMDEYPNCTVWIPKTSWGDYGEYTIYELPLQGNIYFDIVSPYSHNEIEPPFWKDEYDSTIGVKITTAGDWSKIAGISVFLYDEFGNEATGTPFYEFSPYLDVSPGSEQVLSIDNITGLDLIEFFQENPKPKYVLRLAIVLYNPTLDAWLGLYRDLIIRLEGIPIPIINFSSWYDKIIGSFGLSGATPTEIFKKAGSFIDDLFSFSYIYPFSTTSKGTELAEKFNDFLSYIKAIPILSTLIFTIFAFLSFRLIYSVIKLFFFK